MKTFAHDQALPRLPLASPESLCNAVPALAAPLLDEATLSATLDVLSDFVRQDGDAEKLHNALAAHRGSLPANSSWLRPFWDDSYLAWREPLPLNMNYCFHLDREHWGGGVEHFIMRIARTAALLGKNALEAERNRSGYQAMDQARSAFYSRIPGLGADELMAVPLLAPVHITVLCQGFFFLLPLYGSSGEALSAGSLAQCLNSVRDEAARLAGRGTQVSWTGAMTTAPREQAAALRATLKRSQVNRLTLTALEQSLLVLCLDSAAASNGHFAQKLLAGDAKNRWFDKSLQVIATEEGRFGINLEHAGCDAGIWAWLLEKAAALGDEQCAPENKPLPYRRLDWELDETVTTELTDLAENFQQQNDAIELAQEVFCEFSREALKGMRTSPDAFLQVCFQLAQFEVFGELRSSYESVSMRGYAQGRTECARGSTQAALTLAEALRRNEQPSTLYELYRKAERAHLGRLVSCQRGQAVERYVYGLQNMFRQKGKALGITSEPAFFSDPGWLKIKHDSLSTSGMAVDGVLAFAFAPVVEDGFGIGYVPGKNQTVVTVTSFHVSGMKARDFAKAFGSAAQRIAGLLRTTKG